MSKYELSSTEISWIIRALKLEMASIKQEMDSAEDGSPVYALGELAVENDSALMTKLMDMIRSKTKTIRII